MRRCPGSCIFSCSTENYKKTNPNKPTKQTTFTVTSYSNVTSPAQEATCWALSLPGPPGEGWGEDMHKKKGKDLGFLLGSGGAGHRRAPGSCSGGTSCFPQLLLLLGVFPAPSGSVSCSFWECFPAPSGVVSPSFWGQLQGETQHLLPQLTPSHNAAWAPSSAQHRSRLEAPRLKCYRTQSQSPVTTACLSCSSFSPFPKQFRAQRQLCCLSSSVCFPSGGFLDPAWPRSIPLRKALDIWVVFSFLK